MEKVWKNIEGYEGLYQISINGNVKCLRKNKNFLVKKQKGKQGYYMVELNKNKRRKLFTIHRLMAKTFIPNPNNYPCVNHIDGNKTNNKINNLEWCTYSHNNKEAYRLKLKTNGFCGKYGKDNIHSKEVYQLDKNTQKILKSFYSIKEAAQINNCSEGNISMCCKGRRKTAGGFIWKYKKEYDRDLDLI